MYALIKQCLEGNPAAWAELWQLYDRFAAHPVRRLLVDAGIDPSEADDVAQEIYLALKENGGERLRSFQGHSKLELGAWLLKLAQNFTRDWIEQRWRAKKRNRKALDSKASPTRPAATGLQVIDFIESLEGEAVVSHAEADQLRHLVGSGDELEKPASGRTRRRQKEGLEGKVRKYLGLPGRRKSRHIKGKRKKS